MGRRCDQVEVSGSGSRPTPPVRRFTSWRDWPSASDALASLLPYDTVARLASAFQFAAEHHADQRRPSGEPYVVHLLETLEILVAQGVVDPVLLTVGLLHDVVEDTLCEPMEIHRRFGPRAHALVSYLTAPIPLAGAKALARTDYLRRFSVAPADVLRVKLADRYSNVQRLHTHPRRDKQVRYYAETVDWFLPLARRFDFYDRLYGAWASAYGYLSEPDSPQAWAFEVGRRDH